MKCNLQCGDGRCCQTEECQGLWKWSRVAEQVTEEMKVNDGDGCEVLTPDGLCGIQVEFGHEAKPEICKGAKCQL